MAIRRVIFFIIKKELCFKKKLNQKLFSCIDSFDTMNIHVWSTRGFEKKAYKNNSRDHSPSWDGLSWLLVAEINNEPVHNKISIEPQTRCCLFDSHFDNETPFCEWTTIFIWNRLHPHERHQISHTHKHKHRQTFEAMKCVFFFRAQDATNRNHTPNQTCNLCYWNINRHLDFVQNQSKHKRLSAQKMVALNIVSKIMCTFFCSRSKRHVCVPHLSTFVFSRNS